MTAVGNIVSSDNFKRIQRIGYASCFIRASTASDKLSRLYD